MNCCWRFKNQLLHPPADKQTIAVKLLVSWSRKILYQNSSKKDKDILDRYRGSEIHFSFFTANFPGFLSIRKIVIDRNVYPSKRIKFCLRKTVCRNKRCSWMKRKNGKCDLYGKDVRMYSEIINSSVKHVNASIDLATVRVVRLTKPCPLSTLR